MFQRLVSLVVAWNCLLTDRYGFREEELTELESRNNKLVSRELGLLYKEECFSGQPHNMNTAFFTSPSKSAWLHHLLLKNYGKSSLTSLSI